jgi:hypothetical protein
MGCSSFCLFFLPKWVYHTQEQPVSYYLLFMKMGRIRGEGGQRKEGGSSAEEQVGDPIAKIQTPG